MTLILHVETPEHFARVLRDSLRADGPLSAASRPIVLRLDARLLAQCGARPSQ
jgi:hypothetical protein